MSNPYWLAGAERNEGTLASPRYPHHNDVNISFPVRDVSVAAAFGDTACHPSFSTQYLLVEENGFEFDLAGTRSCSMFLLCPLSAASIGAESELPFGSRCGRPRCRASSRWAGGEAGRAL